MIAVSAIYDVQCCSTVVDDARRHSGCGLCANSKFGQLIKLVPVDVSPADRVTRPLEIFSRTFYCFVIIEILLHAYFEYFSDKVENMC